MNYKALITDVDRTLIISEDMLPTERVRQAIHTVARDIHIGVATARPFAKIKHICEYLSLSGPSIVSGGAQIVDVKTGCYYVEYPIDYQTVRDICLQLESFDKSLSYWIQDDGIDYNFSRDYKPHKPFVIVVYGITEEIASQIVHMTSQARGVFVTRVPSYEHGMVDIHITHDRATKQHGVKTIADILGISPSETVGVGDGYNDYPLLMAAGLKVAIGNAVFSLKEIADFVAPSVDDDGLVTVIEKYFVRK